MYEIFCNVSLTVIILSMQLESEKFNAFHRRYTQYVVIGSGVWVLNVSRSFLVQRNSSVGFIKSPCVNSLNIKTKRPGSY